MTTRTSKKQQARELAMQALAEKIANQEKVKTATQEAFLAQAEFDGVRLRFAAALQELDRLGEAQAWMRSSFDLTATELRSLLALTTEDENEPDTADTTAAGSENETHSGTHEDHHDKHQ